MDVDILQDRAGATGDFFRRVVLQRNGMHLDRSTQGHYAFTADGELLRGSNYRDADMIAAHLRRALRSRPAGSRSDPAAENQAAADPTPTPPPDMSVVEVFSRVLEADWPEPKDEEQRFTQQATGRDFLWITPEERASLAAQPPRFPDTLIRRIVRFHVVDNTRCTPIDWGRVEVRELELSLRPTSAGVHFVGHARCRSEDERRTCRSHFEGCYQFEERGLERFDLTVRGVFHTIPGKWSTGAPPGEYVLGIATRLARDPLARQIFPRAASRGTGTYLRATCATLGPPASTPR